MTIEEAACAYIQANEAWRQARDEHKHAYATARCENMRFSEEHGEIRCSRRQVDKYETWDTMRLNPVWCRLTVAEFCPACQKTYQMREEVKTLARRKGRAHGILRSLVLRSSGRQTG